MKCSEQNCDDYAVVSYSWLDQPGRLYACEYHLRVGQELGDALDAPLQDVCPEPRPLPTAVRKPAKQPGWEQV